MWTCFPVFLKGRVFGPLEFSRRDLMAINIQRGRDHGLPDYNTAREVYGLARTNNTDHFKNVAPEVCYTTCRALQFSTNMQNENFCTTSHTAHNNILNLVTWRIIVCTP